MNNREEMIAPCGLDCGVCEAYLSKENPAIRDFLISKGFPEKDLPCTGCRNREGAIPITNEPCCTYECAKKKGHQLCSECLEFPCNKIAPAADKANMLPHNIKVMNLATIKHHGINKFLEKSAEIKKRYYLGELTIGAGPQLNNEK